YSYTHLDDNLVFGFGLRDRQSYQITLTQNIFNKVIFDTLSLAKKEVKLRKLILEDVKKEVKYTVKEFYYALLYKKAVVELERDNVRYWKENLKQVEEKYKAGILPKVEYLRAKAQYESAKARLVNAETDYYKSLEELKAFLRHEGIKEIEGELTYREYPLEGKLWEEMLLENNSTLKIAKQKLKVVKELIDVATANYYPTVQAFAEYQGFTTRRSLFGGKEWLKGYTVGISLNYTFFDGFRREAEIVQKKIDYVKEKENYKETLHKVKAELRKTLLDIKSLKERIKATKLSLEAAKESLRLSTERYREGVATQLEVLDARNKYNEVLKDYLFLLYLYNTNLAKLERLTH
ncbi:TolC family protein, partial [Aquifex sp.]